MDFFKVYFSPYSLTLFLFQIKCELFSVIKSLYFLYDYFSVRKLPMKQKWVVILLVCVIDPVSYL